MTSTNNGKSQPVTKVFTREYRKQYMEYNTATQVKMHNRHNALKQK
jgi:hypothetical protein